jgi:transposase
VEQGAGEQAAFAARCTATKAIRELRSETAARHCQEETAPGWLGDYDAMALQLACLNIDRAFVNFFEGRAPFPSARAAHQPGYHCSGKIVVGKDWIAIPKCPGRTAAVVHRETIGKPKSITLSKTPAGKYFAACPFEDGESVPELSGTKAISKARRFMPSRSRAARRAGCDRNSRGCAGDCRR